MEGSVDSMIGYIEAYSRKKSHCWCFPPCLYEATQSCEFTCTDRAELLLALVFFGISWVTSLSIAVPAMTRDQIAGAELLFESVFCLRLSELLASLFSIAPVDLKLLISLSSKSPGSFPVDFMVFFSPQSFTVKFSSTYKQPTLLLQ